MPITREVTFSPQRCVLATGQHNKRESGRFWFNALAVCGVSRVIRSVGCDAAFGTGVALSRCQPDRRTVLMNVTEAPTQTAEFSLPQWSAAEFLDVPYADGL